MPKCIYPQTAKQALKEGWRMVCVFPTKKFEPSNLDKIILDLVDDAFYPKFTRDGKKLSGKQYALWVKGGAWNTHEGIFVLSHMRRNSALEPFVREIEQELLRTA